MYQTITLCGSGKFKKEFKETYQRLTLEGHTVLMPAIFDHPEDIEITKEMHDNYDRIHRHKIKMSDRIIVINPFGYIGEDTKQEIEFAFANNVPVDYLEYTLAEIPIITVLGSQKFMKHIKGYADTVTREGNLVFTNPMFNHHTASEVGSNISAEDIKMYDTIRRRMIKMSDTIEVIATKDYYIDTDTWNDIEYAVANGKNVAFHDENNEIRHKFNEILKKYNKMIRPDTSETNTEISKEISIPEPKSAFFEIGDRVTVTTREYYNQKGTVKSSAELNENGEFCYYVAFDYPNEHDGDDPGICHKIKQSNLVKRFKED